MPIEAIDPAGLAPLPGAAHVTVATGSRIVHVSGQTGVGPDGVTVGGTHGEQAEQAFRNQAIAIEGVGATPADIARLGLHVVGYTAQAFEEIIGAAIEVFGESLPLTASTLVGVASLWQPDLVFEVDATLVSP